MACLLESDQQDLRSLGVIKDEEYLCRAAFSSHVASGGKIKASFLSRGQFIKGQISVWRMPDASNQSFLTILPKLSPPTGEKISYLYANKAGAIRSSLDDPSFSGRFCAVDECQIDALNNFDPQHAHLTFCRFVVLNEDDADNLRLRLSELIRSGSKWTAPPEQTEQTNLPLAPA